MSSDMRNVIVVVHSAIQRALPFASRLRQPIITAPMSGRNVTIERMGADEMSIYRAPPMIMNQLRMSATPISIAKA